MPTSVEVDIIQNTFVGNGFYGLNADGSNHNVVNNIMSQNETSNIRKQLRLNGTTIYVDSNILYNTTASKQGYDNISCTSCTITDDNYNTQDPDFIDCTNHNYRLGLDSPAVGEGNSRYAQKTDKDGRGRESMPVLLGAYSY